MATKQSVFSRIEIGVPLIGSSVAIAAAGIAIAAYATDQAAVRAVILVLTAILLAVAWIVAARNGRVEKAARLRLKELHPGSLVERVRVWALPHGKLEKDTPMQFLIADAQEISIETLDQDVLIRIPVAELGFLDLVTAQGDRVKDKALTLIYGDEQNTVQVFTLSYDANERLNGRVRTAIGWPKKGVPGPA